MPRPRSPKSIEAERRYKAGEKVLADLARSMGVPEGTLRRWKSTQDWDGKKKQTERSETNPSARNKGEPEQSTSASLDKQLADAVEENEELTAQQKDFCLYYARIKNATQAYLKAYGCSYNTAMTEGCRSLGNPKIKDELQRLREIKVAALGELCGEDVVELHMRIAFADLTDYVEFKSQRVPVTYNGEAVMMDHPDPEEKKKIPVTKSVNIVKLKDSAQVDGQLITEVSEGREGAKIKLADRQKSLDFLERFFSLNPTDRQRKEYDERRLELEQQRIDDSRRGREGAATSNEGVTIVDDL